jgi:hypothetical protein
MTLDKETAEQLRKEAQAKKAAAKKTSSGPRGPQDSGKGVRVVVRVCNCWQLRLAALLVTCVSTAAINRFLLDEQLTLCLLCLQGGKVYDSALGITCHW